MIAIFRNGRLYWILGVALLVGSATSTRWLLNQSNADDGKKPPAAASSSGDMTIFIGYADAETGTRNLHPLVPGRVTELLAEEGQEVAEGALLLRLDDRFARLKITEARASLEAAQQQAKGAARLPQQQAEKVAQQKAVIQAQESKAGALRNDQEVKEKLFTLKQISTEEFEVSKNSFKAQEAMVALEKAKLRELELVNPAEGVARAEADVKAKQAELALAQLALLECDLYAPTAGRVLRIYAHPGELVGAESKLPAIQFCPAGPRIIRAEVMQEWANRVRPGQEAIIEDDTRVGKQWKGSVKQVSDWYTHRRSMIMEPFQFNDVRTLEAIVSIQPGGEPLRIGQRVRVIVK